VGLGWIVPISPGGMVRAGISWGGFHGANVTVRGDASADYVCLRIEGADTACHADFGFFKGGVG
jgi:hypothetical protein